MGNTKYIALVYHILLHLRVVSCLRFTTESASHKLIKEYSGILQASSVAISATREHDIQCRHECKGFPDRSPNYLNSRIVHPKVLVSISASESSKYIRALVENALKYTSEDTMIILHLNANSSYPAAGADEDFDWLWSNPRVEVNCNRWPVARAEGTILQSQMSNVEWAKCRGIASDFVVFQASNSVWLKTGMEAYVEKHVTSVPKITSSATCSNFKYIPGHHAYQVCKEVGQLEVESAARKFHPDKCILPPFEGIKFVMQQKHEGSFYPTPELNRLVSMAEQYQQSHVQAKVQNNCSAMLPNIFDTDFWIEEFFFQSWFGNHETIEGTGDVMCVHVKEKGPRKKWDGTIPWLLSMDGIFMVKHPDLANGNTTTLSDLEQKFGTK